MEWLWGLLYGGLHTYSFVYVVDPFACRLRRPFLSRCLEMVRTAERSTCEWHLAPPYYFNHFRSSRLVSRSVIHRGSYKRWPDLSRSTHPYFGRSFSNYPNPKHQVSQDSVEQPHRRGSYLGARRSHQDGVSRSLQILGNLFVLFQISGRDFV